MKFDLGISQAIILSGHNNYKPFIGSVGVVRDRIICIKEEKIYKTDCDIWVDGTGKILMPGLVNAHCHGDMTLARGFGDDLTLLEQNHAFSDTNWFYSLIDDEDRYNSRKLTYCEALLSGTTFIVENMYWGLNEKSIDAITEVNIRGALAEDIRIDFTNPDKFISDEAISNFTNICRKNNIIPILGSISEEDFDKTRLARIKEKQESFDVFQTCHLAENTWRVDIVKDKFKTTPIDFLYKQNILGKRFIGSHVVYATDEEIKQLAITGTKVVNTPLCEMKINDGIAPIPKMVKEGVVVCLGTDGALWNNSNDIFREMKGMSLLHTINSGIRSLSQKDILDMATINGAKVFGIDNDYGTIEEGKKADFILVETKTPHMTPLRLGAYNNVASSIIYSATGRDVTDVFVDGIRVVSEGILQTLDLNELIEKVQFSSEKIAKSISL